MIDWGEVPPGSTARIYWPAVSSAEVIQLASWMYGVHPLMAADAYTIEVKTFKGVTYVPIPQGTGEWYAGLFTVDLPQTVRTGQEFNIVVRRIGKRPVRVSPPPPRRRLSRRCRLGRRPPQRSNRSGVAAATSSRLTRSRRHMRRPRRRPAIIGSPTSVETSLVPSR